MPATEAGLTLGNVLTVQMRLEARLAWVAALGGVAVLTSWLGCVPASQAAPVPAGLAAAGTVRGHVARHGVTELATVRRTVTGYATPGGRPVGQVPAYWYSFPSVLPVIAARPGWVRVRLARRPDGSTAWLPVRDVRLGSTPYRIVISLATRRMSLYKYGRRILVAPAGIGAPTDPTPTGHFFVAFAEAPPLAGAGYGPFVIVTSAHSRAIGNWEGSGDAIIGIHGPLGADGLIGTTGARISHGCIRLHVADLRKLSGIPSGTPIDIS